MISTPVCDPFPVPPELIQTEFHHVRTLRIMSEVYGKGLLRDAQLEQAAVDRMFPGLDDLLEIHTLFLTLLLDRRERRAGPDAVEGGAVVHRVGDLLLGQVGERERGG